MIVRAPSRTMLRAWGFALAVASVILPALPLGGLFAQPPIPLAVLWAAYGWAAEDESSWRAPVILITEAAISSSGSNRQGKHNSPIASKR